MDLTATANQVSREEIINRRTLTTPARFVEKFDRPNFHNAAAAKTDVHPQLTQFLADHSGEAGMSADTRRLNQERFLRDAGLKMLSDSPSSAHEIAQAAEHQPK